MVIISEISQFCLRRFYVYGDSAFGDPQAVTMQVLKEENEHHFVLYTLQFRISHSKNKCKANKLIWLYMCNVHCASSLHSCIVYSVLYTGNTTENAR